MLEINTAKISLKPFQAKLLAILLFIIIVIPLMASDCNGKPPPPTTHTLKLTKTGTGQGTVTSNPIGINCGTECTKEYKEGTKVILTATPKEDSNFKAWGDNCKTINNTTNNAISTNSCTVTMDKTQEVTAEFTKKETSKHLLTVTKTGQGTVTSQPKGINCGTDCTEQYNKGTKVTLTATPANGYIFDKWQGNCTGTNPTCTLTINSTKNATAIFKKNEANKHQLLVTKTGSGQGTVTSTPAGIICGSNCSGNYKENSEITLTATSNSNSIFTKWTGACTGSKTSCSLKIDSEKRVTARFEQIVNVPDKELARLLRKAVGVSENTVLTKEMLESLKRFDGTHDDSGQAPGGIKSIEGLQYASNLEWLSLVNNLITDAEPLKYLTKLRYLALFWGNSIDKIPDFSKLEHLKELHMEQTGLSDISGLKNTISLEEIDFHLNSISDISALKNLPNLRHLNLFGNEIVGIAALTDLRKLQELVLFDNKITNIKPLVDNSGIGDGDSVTLQNNCIDTNHGVQKNYITELENRGVKVSYEPQRTSGCH